jgi:hypothetical protein
VRSVERDAHGQNRQAHACHLLDGESTELREPFSDPTAGTVLGWAVSDPAIQHLDLFVPTPELPKDDRRALGVGGKGIAYLSWIEV